MVGRSETSAQANRNGKTGASTCHRSCRTFEDATSEASTVRWLNVQEHG